MRPKELQELIDKCWESETQWAALQELADKAYQLGWNNAIRAAGEIARDAHPMAVPGRIAADIESLRGGK